MCIWVYLETLKPQPQRSVSRSKHIIEQILSWKPIPGLSIVVSVLSWINAGVSDSNLGGYPIIHEGS